MAYQPGDEFQVHFVWQLADGDFLRALFAARVLALDLSRDRYLLRLERFVAGSQEMPDGKPRPIERLEGPYWDMVKAIAGKRIHLAFEADDGRPIRLRLATLTGEHTFFSRLDDLPE